MGRTDVASAGLATENATPAPVTSNASNVTLLAANNSRVGFGIFNNADKSMYVRFGATATLTDFTVKLVAGAYYENPPNVNYTGRVDAIWDAGPTGNAYVTEFTEGTP